MDVKQLEAFVAVAKYKSFSMSAWKFFKLEKKGIVEKG